jgi:hypothetical protein
MSSQEWQVIYRTIRSVERSCGRRTRKCTYSDLLILAMYIWTVAHDRPLCWALQRTSYGRVFHPRRLPSYSQFKRRVRTARFEELLAAVNARLAERQVPTPVMYLDGKALPVSPITKDPDARLGRACGGFRRGYKLHALVTQDGRFVEISVTALNVCEKREAHRLLQRAMLGGVVLGDGNYDDAKLYEAALQRRALLFAKPRRGAGHGHHPPSAARQLSLSLARNGEPPLYFLRREIERYFGQLTSFGGGLGPLPAWVRRETRVRRWVTAKLVVYHARLKGRSHAA